MRRTRLHRLLGLLVALTLIAPAANALNRSTGTPVLSPALEAQLAKGDALRVIARFDDAVTDADLAAVRDAGFTGQLVRFTVAPAVSAVGSVDAIRRLASVDGVVRIDANEAISYMLNRSRNVTRSEIMWNATYQLGGVTRTGGFTGRGIGVAVLDSGVDATHPDLIHKDLAAAQGLQPKTVENVKFLAGLADGLVVEGSEFYAPAVNSDTTSGHGTHVAGIVGGTGQDSGGRYAGIAPGANLIGLGAGDGANIFSALAGLEWIHRNYQAHNIRVVNNSWGSVGAYDPANVVSQAVRTLIEDDGIVVVFAAGNSGGDGSAIATNKYANDPKVINVANLDDYTGWAYSGSSRGKKSMPETWPDLAAPGYQIVSTATATGAFVHAVGASYSASTPLDKRGDEATVYAPVPGAREADAGGQRVVAGRYAVVGGTSMASPAVAGIVALMLEANPSLTPALVQDILTRTATMPDVFTYASGGYAMGHGIADTAEAIAVALKMRDGASLNTALATAGLDLTTNPVRVNLSGGVPQTLPGIKFVSPADATPAIYQDLVATGANPFLASEIQVVRGRNVTLAARSMVSRNETNYPLVLGNVSATHRIVTPTGAVVTTVPAVLKADSTGLRADGIWAVPAGFVPGRYFLQTWVTYPSAAVRQITSLAFTVTSAP